MAILGFLIDKFLSDRQRFEGKAFQIFLERISLYPKYEWGTLAKTSIEAARAFDKAMDEATIGLEDIPLGRNR